jgi:hypothetical protein
MPGMLEVKPNLTAINLLLTLDKTLKVRRRTLSLGHMFLPTIVPFFRRYLVAKSKQLLLSSFKHLLFLLDFSGREGCQSRRNCVARFSSRKPPQLLPTSDSLDRCLWSGNGLATPLLTGVIRRGSMTHCPDPKFSLGINYAD